MANLIRRKDRVVKAAQDWGCHDKWEAKMSYKTLVTVIRNYDRDRHCLEAAATLAEAWDAHLDVMALGTDRIHPGAYYAGAAAMAAQASMQSWTSSGIVKGLAMRSGLRSLDSFCSSE